LVVTLRNAGWTRNNTILSTGPAIALGNIRVSMPARWSRVELLVIDELGYVPLAEVAAELLTIEHFAETAGVPFRVSSPPK
jgi:hypothetical protein